MPDNTGRSRRRSSTASHGSGRSSAMDVDMGTLSELALNDAGLPPSEHTDEGSVSARDSKPKRRRRRRANVYDAVAGRIKSSHNVSRTDIAGHFRNAVLAPEEILYRSAGAPPRYEEDDVYFAHVGPVRRAGDGSHSDGDDDALPDTDMLTAMHAYAGRYYEAQALQVARARAWQALRTSEERERRRQRGAVGKKHGRKELVTDEDKEAKRIKDQHAMAAAVNKLQHRAAKRNQKTMDGSAMLAFGILMEAAGEQLLGVDGDMVFTELDDMPDEATQPGVRKTNKAEPKETNKKGEAQKAKAKETQKTDKARTKAKKTGKAGKTQGQAAGPHHVREDGVGGGNEGDDEDEDGDAHSRPRKRPRYKWVGNGETPSLTR